MATCRVFCQLQLILRKWVFYMSMSETAKNMILKQLQEYNKVYYIDLDPEYRSK